MSAELEFAARGFAHVEEESVATEPVLGQEADGAVAQSDGPLSLLECGEDRGEVDVVETLVRHGDANPEPVDAGRDTCLHALRRAEHRVLRPNLPATRDEVVHDPDDARLLETEVAVRTLPLRGHSQFGSHAERLGFGRAVSHHERAPLGVEDPPFRTAFVDEDVAVGELHVGSETAASDCAFFPAAGRRAMSR